MKTKVRFTLTVLLYGITVAANAQHLVSATKIQSLSSSDLNTLFDLAVGTSNAPNDSVDTYKILYNTTDAFNNPTVASGALMIPENTGCDTFPLLSFEHGTVLAKSEVPSQLYDYNIEGYVFSSKGYVVTMPDYLGLGDNPGYHPYLHALTEASASVDLMRAAREFIADSAKCVLDGKVFITGYSQGGHSAMAMLKYIQDSSLLGEFHVVAGAPMSGPYSLSRAESKIISTNYADNGFIPYIVNSYQYVYNNLYTNISNFYISPYDVRIPPYLNGTYTFDSLNNILPTNAFDFMQDSVLTNFLPDTITFSTPLRHDLKLNDNYNWAATMPVKLCYCGSDVTVYPQNSIMAYDSMTARGSADVSIIDINPAFDHSSCELPALSYVLAWFNAFRTDCNNNLSGISDFEAIQNKVSVFPNPASSYIKINAPFIIKELELMDVDGKCIYKNDAMNNNTFELSAGSIENGFYIVKTMDVNGRMHLNKLVVAK